MHKFKKAINLKVKKKTKKNKRIRTHRKKILWQCQSGKGFGNYKYTYYKHFENNSINYEITSENSSV